MQQAIKAVTEKRDLSTEEMKATMRLIMNGMELVMILKLRY